MGCRQLSREGDNEQVGYVVVAHPDDETLYFGGIILGRRDIRWRVVCVTDGGDAGQSVLRRSELSDACKVLHSEPPICLGLPDRYYQPLNIEEIAKKLHEVIFEDNPLILTHSMNDQHHHHRQVHVACCMAFEQGNIVAYTPRSVLTDDLIKQKYEILTHCYASQVASHNLLTKYPWNREGLEISETSVLGILPLRPSAVSPSIANELLVTGLVCGTAIPLLSVPIQTATKDALLSSGYRTYRSENAIAQIWEPLENVLRHKTFQCLTSDLAWIAAVERLCRNWAASNMVTVYRHGSEDCADWSFWVDYGDSAYCVLAISQSGGPASGYGLGVVARDAYARGLSRLRIDPSQKNVSRLLSGDMEGVKFEVERHYPITTPEGLLGDLPWISR